VNVFYEKFNVTSSTPLENHPSNTNSNYSCVVATSDNSWRLSQCTDKHRVVCQSGKHGFTLYNYNVLLIV